MIMLGMATIGQENSRKKINHLFKSEKIYINKRSKGKVKFQVNMKLFILSWPSSRFKIKMVTLLFDIDYVHRLKQ